VWRRYLPGLQEQRDERKQVEKAEEDLEAAKKKDAEGGRETKKLYGIWQTDAWKPPAVADGEDIPVNEFNNVELALINPGLVHVRKRGLAKICKRLGIKCAPCLVEFDWGPGGSGRPVIEGVVVHDGSLEVVLEAHGEWRKNEKDKEELMIVKKWEELVKKLMIGERLEEKWG